MRNININIYELGLKPVTLGYVGENEHTQIIFNCSSVFSQYPNAVPAITVQPPVGDAYPAVMSREEDNVIWNVTNSDLVNEGNGEIQITFTENNIVVKSCIGKVKISKSIQPTGEAPEPIENWLVEANTALNAIPQTIDDALTEAKESGEFDGFSPVITSIEIQDGHRLTITDAEGEKTVDVLNGINGQDGYTPIKGIDYFDGAPGEKGDPGDRGPSGQDGYTPMKNVDYFDGFSPEVSVESITGGHRVSIVDSEGTNTFDVMDGTPGAQGETGPSGPGVPTGGQTGQVLKKRSNTDFDAVWSADSEGVQIDDTAGTGDTDVTWSADKSTTELESKADKTDTVLLTTLSRGRKENTTVGTNSFAFGVDVTSSGANSFAKGVNTVASGAQSHAEGVGTIASGAMSHAEGQGGTYNVGQTTYTSEAAGVADHVEGYQNLTKIGGNGHPGRHAEGFQTQSIGAATHSEGNATVASGDFAHSEGYGTTASGTCSHAEGFTSIASGNFASHAEGYQTEASGHESHAEGCVTEATGNASHAEGQGTVASGTYGSHAEGYYTEALGNYGSHAEGDSTRALYYASHSEGVHTEAESEASHAEGSYTKASNYAAHAEGYYTLANGTYSHVSGIYNVGDSYDSWPEWTANTQYDVGDKVKRTAANNAVSGYICRVANSDSTFNQLHWFGQSGRMNYAEIIGNGTDDNTRSNARVLDWDGNERIKGDLYVGCNSDSTGGTKVAKTSEVAAVDNQVVISSSQPQSSSNKLWVDSTGGSEVSVPTYNEFTSLANSVVTDVQTNGTSIVNNGVANIPVADVDTLGTVKVRKENGYYGIGMTGSNTLTTSPANDNQVKGGTEPWKPLNPMRQHLAVFFGLSKVAGVDLANAGVTLGEYPDSAKIAIQKMLGVYQSPWELISDYTTTENLATVDVLTDTNGEPFECEEIYVRAIIPASTTGNADYFTTQVHTKKTDTSNVTSTCPTLSFSATASKYAEYKLTLINGIISTIAKAGSSWANTQNAQMSSSMEVDYASFRGFRLKQYSSTTSLIPSGTNIKIFGKRKWT